MKSRIITSFLNMVLFSVCLQSQAFCYTSRTLSELWELEKTENSVSVRASTLQYMSMHHVLFIGGLLSGLDNSGGLYFKDNRDAVENELNSTASFFSPNSKSSVWNNIASVSSQITQEYQKYGKPLLLVGHSKGAAEIFSVLLSYPELVLDRIVDGAILVQGVIGGTPLAEPKNCGYLLRGIGVFFGSGPDSLRPKARLSENTWLFHQFMHNLELFYPGVDSDFIEQKRQMISQRIIFSPSFEASDNLSTGLRALRALCYTDQCIQEENDGLIPVSAQKSGLLGTSLDPLRADHWGLAVSLPNKLTSSDRKAYTRALFEKSVEVFSQ